MMRPSGLDASDGPVSVVDHPDGIAAYRDGPGFRPHPDRPPRPLAALEVDPGDRVLGGAGDPDGAGAGVDPARAATDLDRVAEHGVDRGVDLGDGVAAAV